MDDFDPKVCISGGEVAFAHVENLYVQNVNATLNSRTPRKISPKLWASSVFVIGGITKDTEFHDHEKPLLDDACYQVGNAIARGGADLIVCSPFPDAADVRSVMGYVAAGAGGRVHFHSPQHERVQEMKAKLNAALGPHNTRFIDCNHPGPSDEEGWPHAWVLSQIQALEQAQMVVAIGGRNSTHTLLHLAEQKKIPILPFPFLGGAARTAFERQDWLKLYPNFTYEKLKDRASIRDIVNLANQILSPGYSSYNESRAQPNNFFISRARKDAALGDKLEIFFRKIGKYPLLGDHEINHGRMVVPAIDDAIIKSDIFIALWSQAYACSKWCIDELELALDKHGESRILVINTDGTDITPKRARKLPQINAKNSTIIARSIADRLGIGFVA